MTGCHTQALYRSRSEACAQALEKRRHLCEGATTVLTGLPQLRAVCGASEQGTRAQFAAADRLCQYHLLQLGMQQHSHACSAVLGYGQTQHTLRGRLTTMYEPQQQRGDATLPL